MRKIRIIKVPDPGYFDLWRIYAINNIKSDYVIYLDPDDESSDKLIEDINNFTNYDGYYIKRYYYSYYSLQLRIFKRSMATSTGYIYSQYKIKGKTVILPDEYYLKDHSEYLFDNNDKMFRYFFIDNMERSIPV